MVEWDHIQISLGEYINGIRFFKETRDWGYR
jgi:hypothetical protein